MRIPGALLAFSVATSAAADQVRAPEVSLRPAARAGTEVAVTASANLGFDRWIADFRDRATAQGISSATFDAALGTIRYNADVVGRDRNQSEFTKQIWDYLDSAVSSDRVSNGRAAFAARADLFAEIERLYGVEAEVVAAIWGLESAYGSFRGTTPTVEALATLAYDGRRGAFFEEQLLAALRILEAGDVTPRAMTGSWAGAMGHTQFMPTSYLAHAQDFDGDGRRNIWGDDPTDALASAAAYLRDFGWTNGQPWGVEVRLPEGFDYAQSGERIKKSPSDWAAMGVRDTEGRPVPNHGRASILLPAGARGAAFMIFDNFHVIERYNPADAYVIAVGHLSDRIRGAGPLRAGWPREDRNLRFAEKQEMQERLTRAGFDTQGTDGIIGPNTIAAIRAFQKTQGLTPDGYASYDLLQRLR